MAYVTMGRCSICLACSSHEVEIRNGDIRLSDDFEKKDYYFTLLI